MIINDKRFLLFTQRAVGEVIAIADNKIISAYSRFNALASRDSLLGRKVNTAAVTRNFKCIKVNWNYSAQQHGVVTASLFANMN
jgi:hypothetical protein